MLLVLFNMISFLNYVTESDALYLFLKILSLDITSLTCLAEKVVFLFPYSLSLSAFCGSRLTWQTKRKIVFIIIINIIHSKHDHYCCY